MESKSTPPRHIMMFSIPEKNCSHNKMRSRRGDRRSIFCLGEVVFVHFHGRMLSSSMSLILHPPELAVHGEDKEGYEHRGEGGLNGEDERSPYLVRKKICRINPFECENAKAD